MDAETRRRVDERLEELYRRHLALGEAEGDLAGYYSSEHGYYEPRQTTDEGDRFSLCLVTVDGDVHVAGDHELPFPLHSLSKVFVYGMALEEHGRDEVLWRVGVKPSADSFTTTRFHEGGDRGARDAERPLTPPHWCLWPNPSSREDPSARAARRSAPRAMRSATHAYSRASMGYAGPPLLRRRVRGKRLGRPRQARLRTASRGRTWTSVARVRSTVTNGRARAPRSARARRLRGALRRPIRPRKADELRPLGGRHVWPRDPLGRTGGKVGG